MTLDFAVLGPLAVVADGQPLMVGGSRERALLCLLLVYRGAVLSVARIAEDLWDGRPPDQAAAAVRVYVARLRKARGADLIETRAPGSVLAAGPASPDACRFDARATDAHAPLARGDAPWPG